MQIHVRGTPSFDNLLKWEKEALINPLLEVIKEFYTKEENRQAYEKWKLKREQLKQAAIENLKHEIKSAI